MNNIIQGFPTPQKEYYKVYVRSVTYNQAPYIKDCLNGVAMQETNFPFVHHVIDDASTDGEQEVIKAWIDKNCDIENAEFYDNDICTITFVKNKNNPNCTLAAYFLKKNMYGNPKKGELYKPWRDVCPYEALCEGDDYWIEAKKLQKQVDFLNSHPEYSLCFTNFRYLINGELKNSNFNYPKQSQKVSVEDVIQHGGWVFTASRMYRTIFLPEILNLSNGCCVGDYPQAIALSFAGYVYFINDVTSIYRRGHSGSWVTNFNESSIGKKRNIGRNISEMLEMANQISGYKYKEAIYKAEFLQYSWGIDWKYLGQLKFARFFRKSSYVLKIKYTLSLLKLYGLVDIIDNYRHGLK